MNVNVLSLSLIQDVPCQLEEDTLHDSLVIKVCELHSAGVAVAQEVVY